MKQLRITCNKHPDKPRVMAVFGSVYVFRNGVKKTILPNQIVVGDLAQTLVDPTDESIAQLLPVIKVEHLP